MNFDSRVLTLHEDINPEWDASVKEQHRINYANLIASLSVELGPVDFHRKLEDFKAIGRLPFSIFSYHVDFMRQARGAFVQGFYYPALTSSCALGERILNHLVLDLRDYFTDKKSHAKVAEGNSFDSWQKMLHVLGDWDVLLPEAMAAFRKLEPVRHKSLHFNVSTYADLRGDALKAINLISTIVETQFAAVGTQPWFVPNVRGASFIRPESEQTPFVNAFYVPHCPLVGFKYSYVSSKGQWLLFDYRIYEDRSLSDEEFVALLEGRKPDDLAPTTLPPSPDVVCYEWTAVGWREWQAAAAI